MKITVTAVLLVWLCGLAYVAEAKRRLRPRLTLPYRDESTPDKCMSSEYHVRCGVEHHCERSCNNLFSPPYCASPDETNPKCFFPRCLCKGGYVRDKHGKCVRPTQCKVNYEEAFFSEDPDGIFFKSQQRMHRLRRARHHRKPEEDNFFW